MAFIVPTRRDQADVRMRALRSLLAQHDPDWLAVVVGEGFVPTLPLEARYYAVKSPDDLDGEAGAFNVGMTHIKLAAALGQVNPEWIGFLDPGDTVSERYVSRLGDVGKGVDVVIFRAVNRDGIKPHPLYPAIIPGDVTYGFAVRRRFAEDFNIKFSADAPDIPHFFLRQCMRHGARVLLYPDVTYFVEDRRP